MTATALPQLLDKALALLDAVIADGGRSVLTDIAGRAGLPAATAYRLAATLVQRGFLINPQRGLYLPGPLLVAYAGRIDAQKVLARVAAPLLRDVAKRFGQVAHLGILDGGMVTYLVKTGPGAAAGFARLGMQLEAYCSGVGKVLLAHLPQSELEDYLSNGPFVRLTPNTIIEPSLLRAHLGEVRDQGFALDDAEIAEDLKCVAVPLIGVQGRVSAAVSLSGPAAWITPRRLPAARRALVTAAREIAGRMGYGD